MNACFALPAQTTLRLSWLRRKRKRRKEEIYVCIYIIFIYLLGQQGDQTVQFYYKDWSWSSNTLATLREGPTLWTRPWCWERVKAGGEGDSRGWDVGWHYQLSGRESEQMPRDGEGQGSLVCCSPWGLKESDTTYWLNNNYIYIYTYIYIFKIYLYNLLLFLYTTSKESFRI